MAYRGFAAPIIARRTKTEDGNVYYTDGIVCGRGIKIEIDPVYEDISDYEDINETGEKKIFAYAEVKLNTAELLPEAENIMFAHEIEEDCVISKDTDMADGLGVGMYFASAIRGVRNYVVIWLHNVSFTEDGSENNTKRENSEYDTPISIGKAAPEDDGTWRTKKFFSTSDKAMSWLKEMAGIKEQEE